MFVFDGGRLDAERIGGIRLPVGERRTGYLEDGYRVG
jgi:hypothetical protein